MSQHIALAKDEVAGKGLFKGKRAEGDRYQELEQQIKIWEALREKLANEPPT
ncbi:MAG: hypothetical protein Kow00121_20780 [Elainellaceae cyanobacterium]